MPRHPKPAQEPQTALAPRRGPIARRDGLNLPSLIAQAGERAQRRFVEYFAAEIRNPHTRRAYAGAAGRFLAWCDGRGLALEELQPFVVAAYVEELGRELAAPSVKQHLAALRMLFDYLVVGQVLAGNPAAAVRGPRLVIRTGKTPVLEETEARTLLASVAGEGLAERRDKALLAVMLYSFARVGAIVRLRVRDYENQRRRAYLALREKGGQHRRVPVHSRAAEALDAYLEAAGIGNTPQAPLFQALAGKSGELAGHALTARSALRVVKRRASAAGIGRDLGCHSCRATGITAYLVHGGTLERAAAIAGHASTRTTQLYDRRRELVEPDEIERVKF
ncbi:MAG TPA: tyrosine-type recombinase/integrase, partial [Thermoanaerobaculia bacterium]|nr:tyrosine-type recombinase/integrase [Thermoanaerobaculia bacterium]